MTILKWFAFTSIPLLFAVGCKDTTVEVDPFPKDNFSENYKYYPLSDGSVWTYKTTIDDKQSGITTFTETATYDLDSGKVFFAQGGPYTGWRSWTNTNNQLQCCGGRVLIDYNQLDCTDSLVLIDVDVSFIEVKVYQFCDLENVLESKNFSEKKCLKTYQRNIFEDDSELHIERYFAKDIGLIYSMQTRYWSSGAVRDIETTELMSYLFP